VAKLGCGAKLMACGAKLMASVAKKQKEKKNKIQNLLFQTNVIKYM
jgi:hypothetical protein